MHNWKVGDLARTLSSNPTYHNVIVEIEALQDERKRPGYCLIRTPLKHNVPGTDPHVWAILYKQLVPIDDDYDGNQITSWNECPFKPKQVVTITNQS